MPELLETIESLRGEEADVHRLFAAETDTGYRGVRRRQTAERLARVATTAEFLADLCEGRRPMYHLQEALTTSDFPSLFGDVIDRSILADYREYPADWQGFVSMGTVRDFRQAKLFTLDGGEGQLDPVDEKAAYPYGLVDDNVYTIQVGKYGRQIGFSWEALINDDLRAFMDTVGRLGRAARRTEYKEVTKLFVDASGPHASFYTSGNKNQIVTANGAATNNPVFSITALGDAMTVLGRMVDVDGEPISIESVHLVVPPALRVAAMNILNATEIRMLNQGGATGQEINAANWMKNGVTLHVDPYIPLVATTANGATSWFLFADPGEGRPAIGFRRLTGHEEPETFIKAPDATRVGGASDPLQGDFETDEIKYKVRHVFGGSRLDPKATVASNGSGV